MVGSVLYFTTFCLDKLGQPLLNENPQQTDGWIVPTYLSACQNAAPSRSSLSVCVCVLCVFVKIGRAHV